MTQATLTYAKNAEGKLVAFEVATESYAEAIDAVKAELGVERALVLVRNA